MFVFRRMVILLTFMTLVPLCRLFVKLRLSLILCLLIFVFVLLMILSVSSSSARIRLMARNLLNWVLLLVVFRWIMQLWRRLWRRPLCRRFLRLLRCDMATPSKKIPDLGMISRELAGARKRRDNQAKLVKDAQDGLAYAMTSGLKSTEAVIRARLPRLQAALAVSDQVVSELEAVVGTLPISGS